MKRIILKPNNTFKHWHTIQPLSETVEVSDSIAFELSQNPAKAYVLGAVVDYVLPYDFNVATQIKMFEINGKSSQALSSIVSQYTREEIDSWPTQETEAGAWTGNNTAPTPLLDAMVANRPSVDKAGLVLRILTNATNYKAFSGAVIGKKQALEDQVNALPATATQTDIDAIIVAF